MSAKRIKLRTSRRPLAPKRPMLAREGHERVWTRNGFLPREAYEQTRAERPELALPKYEALPLLP